jgi:ketosteroid isomerase-like protein
VISSSGAYREIIRESNNQIKINMKKSILIIMVAMIGVVTYGQENEEKSIKELITNFAKAADKSDAKELATYLDENYRIVMNRLFGSESVSIINKTDYLAKIETKEWGGDKRTVEVHSIVINGATASAHVTLKGEKATFISIFTLIKNAEGEWRLVSDTPIVA